MAVQAGTTLRNAILDVIESTIGTSAKLKFFTGTQPATCATADSGTTLIIATLPSDWMNAASGGTKTLLGTWNDTSADASGTAGYWRIYDSGVTTCHLQGSITVTGGGGDITLNTTTITAAGTVTITAFTITAANA